MHFTCLACTDCSMPQAWKGCFALLTQLYINFHFLSLFFSFLSFCLFGFITYIFDIFRTDFVRYGLRTDATYFIRCSNKRVHLFQDRIKNWMLDCKTLFKRLSKYSWLYAIFIHTDFRTDKRLPYHTSWEEYLTSTICELRIHYTENTVYTFCMKGAWNGRNTLWKQSKPYEGRMPALGLLYQVQGYGFCQN